MSLRIRRGTNNERSGIVFDLGELVWTNDGQQLWVGDGVTQGGINVLALAAGTGLSWNATTRKIDLGAVTYTTNDIAEGSSADRKYFSDERAQDAVAAALVAGVGNVAFVYNTTQDGANRIDASVTLDGIGITSVSADTTPALGGNLTLTGHDITGTGNIDITGDIDTIGSISATVLIQGALETSTITSANPTIAVGTNSSPSYLTVSSSTEPLSIFRGITDNVTPPNIFINVSRGTLTTPTTVAAGDEIGGINVKVFDGASFKSVSNILTAVADDAVMSDLNPKSDVYIAAASGGSSFALFEFRGDGTLVVPGNGTASAPSIAFSADASSDTGFFHPGDGIIGVAINAQEKARWNTDGLQVDGAVRVGNTYTTSPDTRPVSPVAGMIIFETTTNSFQGWNGSSWVTLG